MLTDARDRVVWQAVPVARDVMCREILHWFFRRLGGLRLLCRPMNQERATGATFSRGQATTVFS